MNRPGTDTQVLHPPYRWVVLGVRESPFVTGHS